MDKYKSKSRIVIIVLLLITCMLPIQSNPSLSFSDQILEVGIKGDDVIELQGRLKFLGYYSGQVDGEFGWKTYWSVRNFQYEFGILIDGVVGSRTKLKLWEATKNWRPGRSGNQGQANKNPASYSRPMAVSTYDENDRTLLARAVYSEARGEPYEGQVAIAAVILNRISSPLFPNSVSGVIFEPRAFTAVEDGQYWGLQPDEDSYTAVNDAINGWDPASGALYYFNPNTATSDWIWSRPQIKRIGKHIFCR